MNWKNFKWIMALIGLCIAAQGRAQYYPGGLGNSNLVLWLNAFNPTSISRNGSNQVSQWSDLSGHGYNFTQGVTGNMPVYGAATGPNGHPALTYTSTSSQYLSNALLPSSISFTGGTSVFSVASFGPIQTAQGWQRIFDFGNGQASNNLMFGRYGASANIYYEAWNGGSGDQTHTSTIPIINGNNNIYESIQQGGAVATNTAVAFYLAGNSQAATGTAGSSVTWVPTSVNRISNYLGRSHWAADNYFSGTMSELLLYNTSLNTTQRVIAENYLSAAWGLPVSVSRYTPPSPGVYSTNLVGIGYTSAVDNFLSNPSGSTDGLGFSSGTMPADFLNSAGYAMAAHNGQNNTILINTSVPGIGSSINRWNRSWHMIHSAGNPAGMMTLNFDFNAYNATTPPAGTTFFLVFNATDGTFSTGSNQVAATSTGVAGDVVSFAVKASSLTTGYYTLMWCTTLPAVSIIPASICSGGNSTVTGSVINGFTLQWQVDNGSGFANVPAVDPGGATYSGATTTALTINGATSSMNGYRYRLQLSATNGPAVYEGPATLTVNPNPATAPLTATSTSICAGSGTTLSISGPTPGITYHIYSDAALTIPVGTLTSIANSLPVTPAATTTYYEQGVDPVTGCTQTSAATNITVTFNPTPAAASLTAAPTSICAGSGTTLSISGPTPGINYHIYSDAALTIPVGTLTSIANSLPITPATTTTYYEQAVDATTGCTQTTASNNTTITVNPNPAAAPITAASTSICAGSGTTLSISGPTPGITYHIYSDPALTIPVGTLTTAANSLPITPASTTTYYEQAVDATTGCTQTSAANNITITVNIPALLSIQGKPLICLGDSITLTALAPGATIAWPGYGSGASIIDAPQSTTTYTAIATTAAGCADTASLTVTVSSWSLSLTASPNPIVAGFPVTITTNGTALYSVTAWDPASQFPAQQANSQTFIISDTAKTYTVKALSVNGCTDTASITVGTLTNEADVFIPNAFTPNGDGRNDLFKVYGSSIQKLELYVFNQWGQLVFSTENPAQGWDGRYKGALQPAGIFLFTARIHLYGRTTPILKKGSVNLIR